MSKIASILGGNPLLRSSIVVMALVACGSEPELAAPTGEAAEPTATATASASTLSSAETAREAALREAAEFGFPGRIGGPITATPFGSGGLDPSIWGEEIGGPGMRSAEPPRGKGPLVRRGELTVNGRLPPEVVQRVMRQNFGRFRLCYENGLRTAPKLEGKVTLAFTIRRDGKVEGATATTDLTDKAVSTCMARAVESISFPSPDGGVAKVTFELLLTPPAEAEPSKSAQP